MNNEPTVGDAIEDMYYADHGVRTGTALNELLVSQREMQNSTPMPMPAPAPRGGGGGGGMGFVPFLLMFGPGLWAIGPVAEPLINFAERKLPKFRVPVGILLALVLAVLAFQPLANPLTGWIAQTFDLTTSASQVSTAVAGLAAGYWLGAVFVALTEGILNALVMGLGFVLSISLYLAVIYGGYMAYLRLFDGTEIGWISGMYDYLFAGIRWLFT